MDLLDEVKAVGTGAAGEGVSSADASGSKLPSEHAQRQQPHTQPLLVVGKASQAGSATGHREQDQQDQQAHRRMLRAAGHTKKQVVAHEGLLRVESEEPVGEQGEAAFEQQQELQHQQGQEAGGQDKSSEHRRRRRQLVPMLTVPLFEVGHKVLPFHAQRCELSQVEFLGACHLITAAPINCVRLEHALPQTLRPFPPTTNRLH